jgi:hypothetical protein
MFFGRPDRMLSAPPAGPDSPSGMPEGHDQGPVSPGPEGLAPVGPRNLDPGDLDRSPISPGDRRESGVIYHPDRPGSEPRPPGMPENAPTLKEGAEGQESPEAAVGAEAPEPKPEPPSPDSPPDE